MSNLFSFAASALSLHFARFFFFFFFLLGNCTFLSMEENKYMQVVYSHS